MAKLSLSEDVKTVTREIGNGSQIVSYDTVPFVIWAAARHLDNFEDAMWTTVSSFGDVDTTCAMVGGIVSQRVGKDQIPDQWVKFREPLPEGFELADRD